MSISPDAIGQMLSNIKGQLRLSQHERLLYATDASLYQIEPLGVFEPENIGALAEVTLLCGRQGIPLLPRAGGTSLAGQCVNQALVVDCSPNCRAILKVDTEKLTCHVEPGITIDDLNRSLDAAGYKLFFAPDPATSAQACIGGCIGNNAAGARSIIYGRTSENIAALEVALSSGERLWLGPGAGRRNDKALELAVKINGLVHRYKDEIKARFPKTKRRNTGYALDMVLEQIEKGVEPEDLDLSCLICGSEGTLAVVLSADLKLTKKPAAVGLCIVPFPSSSEAISSVPATLTTGPSAVELIDEVVLAAAAKNKECQKYLEVLPDLNGKAPGAVLYVEYRCDSEEEVEVKISSLKSTLSKEVKYCADKKAVLKAWLLRKAGEPLLHGLEGHRKPVSGFEDCAIPIENLEKFTKEFKSLLTRHNTHAAYWAHASVGVLHIRPFFDLHREADRNSYVEVAREMGRLAKECKGALSGEHGDGRSRGPLLKDFFGPELMKAFFEVKEIFDPAGILNPGVITPPAPVESMMENLRVMPRGQQAKFPNEDGLYFSYQDAEGFSGALEMCNGAGVCRKNSGGVMCPSYRATADERHATRGRGNALRLAVSGQFNGASGIPAWNDPGTLETLKLCLSCKACSAECPSNVDIARLKAEYLAQSYKAAGRIPLSEKLFGNVRLLGKLGSAFHPLANATLKIPLLKKALSAALGLSSERKLPPYARSLFSLLENRKFKTATHKVVLFTDCFVTYHEPSVGLAAIDVLETFGYEVIVPDAGCCGRAMISTGLLAKAVKSADRLLEKLSRHIEDPAVKAVIVCEPSCLSAFRDDYLKLKLSAKSLAEKLAAKSYSLEEFLENHWGSHPVQPEINPARSPLLVHGHCHQKAGGSMDVAMSLLSRFSLAKPALIESTCCGMAGSFGYRKDLYPVSVKIGELSLFPAVRQASADTTIVASGTSCRHQISDGTGRKAVHAAQAIVSALARQ